MPVWPGGKCPKCGEFMPENLVHCQNCRALLNDDLDPKDPDVAEFVPLKEVIRQVKPICFFVRCPECGRELRVSRKHVGEKMKCLSCETRFQFSLESIKPHRFLAVCPWCQSHVRPSYDRLKQIVVCKECGAKLQFVVRSQKGRSERKSGPMHRER